MVNIWKTKCGKFEQNAMYKIFDNICKNMILKKLSRLRVIMSSGILNRKCCIHSKNISSIRIKF